MITLLVVIYLAGFVITLGAVKEGFPDTPVWLCLPAAIIWPLAVLWGFGAGLSKRVGP